MAEIARLLEPILALHATIRATVVAAGARSDAGALAEVASDGPGDTIYAVDRVSEAALVSGLLEISRTEPLCLLAEGLPIEGVPLPHGITAAECRWRVLVDPIDGTRGLMYQKRSAWILTGVAPNRGATTRLRDIGLAVQTEIPLQKQHLSDQLWAIRGAGVQARRVDRVSGSVEPLTLRPSREGSIAHGFSSLVRFFPGAGELLGAIDDEISLDILGPPAPGKAASFEDQYASTGGQLYELMAGHDRFIADLRPLAQPGLAARGLPPSLCCHPYDLATALIAEEAGIVLTDPTGAPLDGPFDVTSDLSWVGYANSTIRQSVEPALQRALRRRGLLPPSRADN